MTEWISVSKDSLDSVRAYVTAAKNSLGGLMTIQSNAARSDLDRALQCLDEAPKQDDEQ